MMLLSTGVGMEQNLQSCPDDVVDSIVQQLSLKDVRNLRLTCTALAKKTSHNAFRKYFKSQHVEMTVESLQSFIDGIQSRGPRSLVEHLYLVGVVDEPPEGDEWAEIVKKGPELRRLRQEILLRQVFYELAQRTESEIHLTLTLRQPPGLGARMLSEAAYQAEFGIKKRVLQCARTTFSIAMRALAVSQLKLSGLNLFNDPKMVPNTASALTSEHFNTIDWSSNGIVETLASLKSLSVCFAPPALDESRTNPDVRAEAGSESMLTGLIEMITGCPQLEDLRLRRLPVYLNSTQSFAMSGLTEGIMKCLAELDPPLRLRQFGLQGIIADGADLHKFLIRTRPCELSLNLVTLETGSWRQIFDYCTSPEAGMTKLSGNILRERDERPPHSHHKILFQPPVPGTRASNRMRKLNLEGSDLKQPIAYYLERYLPMNPMMARHPLYYQGQAA